MLLKSITQNLNPFLKVVTGRIVSSGGGKGYQNPRGGLDVFLTVCPFSLFLLVD